MILSKPQAEAVYSAMCALNNVGGSVDRFTFGQARTAPEVRISAFGGVNVDAGAGPTFRNEFYPDQAAFATAYGLNSDEWQSDIAAAAGGLTQVAIER